MEQDRKVAEWTRTAQPVRPNFATLVAVAVARQSASPTAQVIASAEAGAVEPVSLVDLFGSRGRTSAVAIGCFNSGVAALLTPEKEI
jgi:hypothetical protein